MDRRFAFAWLAWVPGMFRAKRAPDRNLKAKALSTNPHMGGCQNYGPFLDTLILGAVV